ncbi:MAG: RNA polymerase sigma-70 factor [Chitinophagaceae bacterium]
MEENTLLTLLKKGDVLAFEYIYKQYWYHLYCIALKYLHSKEDAEEVLQQLFEKLWKKRTSLIIKDLGPYLAASLHNMVIDFHRKKKRHSVFVQNYLHVEQYGEGPEMPMSMKQLDQEVELAIDKLPQKTKDIFCLSRYNNKSNKEIASLLKISEKTVEYHITKSLQFLKWQLKEFFLAIFLLFLL